jgi:hypothetical protein
VRAVAIAAHGGVCKLGPDMHRWIAALCGEFGIPASAHSF